MGLLNAERLGGLLEALPAHHRYAFEFRDPSWNVPEIADLLTRFAAAAYAVDNALQLMKLVQNIEMADCKSRE